MDVTSDFYQSTLAAISTGSQISESDWQKVFAQAINDFFVDSTCVDIPTSYHNLLEAVNSSEINGTTVNRTYCGIIEPVPGYRPKPIFVQLRIKPLDYPLITGTALQFFLHDSTWTVTSRNSVIYTIDRETPSKGKQCGGTTRAGAGGGQHTRRNTNRGSPGRTKPGQQFDVSDADSASNQTH